MDSNGVILILDESPLPKKEDISSLSFASSSSRHLSPELEIISKKESNYIMNSSSANENTTNDASNDNDREKNENSSCCICMEDYQTGDHMVTLPCLHVFHRDCIIPWLKNCATCPIDKSEILSEG